MAIKYSVFPNGKTIAIANDGKRKMRKTFSSKSEAINWYNNQFLNGASGQPGVN